jgi:hypothetical protein
MPIEPTAARALGALGRSSGSEMAWLNARTARLAKRAALALVCAAFCRVELVAAQVTACADTLALYSPQELSVSFEAASANLSAGTRIRWRETDRSQSSCARMVISDALLARLPITLEGAYSNIHDRDLRLRAREGGIVGDPNVDLVRFAIEGTHPNTAIPPMSGSINLSNRGGIFGVDTSAANASAAQHNAGVPNHLERANITAFSGWSAPDNSAHRLYAAMEGVPLLRSDDGGVSWIETARGGVDPIGFPVTRLAVSPSDPNLVFIGTSRVGLWVSRDGGVSFALADAAIRPNSAVTSTVTLLSYVQRPGGGHRLFVALSGLGFFSSDDDGTTWQVNGLQVPDPLPQAPGGSYLCPGDAPSRNPIPRALRQSPLDPNRIYIGVDTWGVYRSDDGGVTWVPANTGLVNCSPDRLSRENADVEQIRVIQSGSDERVIVSTQFRAILVSTDRGGSWFAANGLPVDPQTTFPTRVTGIVPDRVDDQRLFVGTPNLGLFESTDAGASWQPLVFGPAAVSTPRIGALIQDPADPSRLVVGTTGAGVYVPGTPIDLSRAIRPATGVHTGANLSLGLILRFAPGTVALDDEFHLLMQSFQGYAVWRALDFNEATGEPRWELIGLYDRLNPESCSPSGCDVISPIIVQGCFSERRANCFTFHADGTVSFFDRDVFNGFTYRYAVSTYDYLFGAYVSPRSFNGEMLFSPRSPQESSPYAAPFVGLQLPGGAGNYNQVSFQVNLASRSTLDEVFVVPNPLRREAGWDTGDQSSVRFFNVTENAVCTVYTLAGDFIAELRNVVIQGEQKGIIEWDTRNFSGNSVASGVYIYRITNSAGDETIGRFTIIR